YAMSRLLIGSTLTHPELARSCRVIFQEHLGTPLTRWFQHKIETGEIPNNSAEFLAEQFALSIFSNNLMILDPERVPNAAMVGQLASQRVRLFLFGCSR